MILVDTSVWIDYLRAHDPHVLGHLTAGSLAIHSMVIGELACGDLSNRSETIAHLFAIPKLEELSNDIVIEAIEQQEWMGRGIGFIDAHLIASTLHHRGAKLWTRDKNLRQLAQELGVAYAETTSNGDLNTENAQNGS